MESSITLKGDPEQVSVARRFIRKALGEDHPALDSVTLLASELVTNSVVHSDSRNGGRIVLTLAQTGPAAFQRAVLVSVADEGGRTIPRRRRLPRLRRLLMRESGRGLDLVAELAAEWGVQRPSENRTVTWFRLTSGESGSDSPLSTPPYEHVAVRHPPAGTARL
jgi:anti-sigma regulatory factor (Ser/Thr protein kinase)